MNEKNHSAEERLITKCLAGEATAAEEKALQDWIMLSKVNDQTYQDIKKGYELSKKHYSPNAHNKLSIDVEQEWNHFLKKAEQSENGKTVYFQPQRTPQTVWLRIAAAMLLVVVSGVIINYFASQSSEQVYQTAENTETVTLPDGSTVFINRNSKLSYSKTFGEKNREVSLTGEGFFEVVPNPQSPFIVRVDKAEVTVLGTSFNVQGYNNRSEIEVTVETGIVKLESVEIGESVKLTAGEKGVFKKREKELISDKNENSNYLSWKTRRIVFDGSSLSSVAQALESTFGVEVVISAIGSDACEVTVTFDNQSLEAVLNVLKSTLNLTYKVEGNKIEITKAGC